MIDAIVADVDGVMVGGTPGVNFPLPNDTVLSALNEIHSKKGIPIILCTAKFHAAIDGIIQKARLNNPHITDGGALIIDPLDKQIISKHIIGTQISKKIVSQGLRDNIYTEFYTSDAYFIQKSQISDFTQEKTKILQKEAKIVDNLQSLCDRKDVIKINAYCINNNLIIDRWDSFLRSFKNIHYIWTMHPSIPNYRSTTITTAGVSKHAAVDEVLRKLGISSKNVLGIGDTLSDWNFMEHCEYKGVVGNDTKELIDLVRRGKADSYFIGPSVEENGLLDIFKFFKLI